MAKKPLNKIRKEKHGILTNAYRSFIGSVKTVEKKIFKFVSILISTFNTEDERIIDGDDTQKAIRAIKSEFKNFLEKSALDKRVKEFTTNFDNVERLSTQIIAQANDIPVKELRETIDVTDIKNLYVDQITEGILSKSAIDVELVNPIRQIAFQASTSGIKIKDAEKQIKDFLLGKGENGGKLVNRSRFFAVETIHRFNGAIHTQFCKKYNANVFKILNPLINTSVQNCVDMVEGSGELGELAIGHRTYLIEDIPEIIKIGKKMGHISDGTTPENYFINRNHFGCLHDFECSIRSDEWIEKKKKERDKRNS